LHQAAFRNDTVLIESLIENGTSIEIKDENGQTPLQRAAEFSRKQAFKTLERLGADTNVRDKYGCTPSQRFLYDKYVFQPICEPFILLLLRIAFILLAPILLILFIIRFISSSSFINHPT
jgi:ankyrin repeat protein